MKKAISSQTVKPRPCSVLASKAFIVSQEANPFLDEVLDERALARLSEMLEVDRCPVTPKTIENRWPELLDCEFLIATWGFPGLLAERLAGLPRLKAVLYAGGSVRAFARPFLMRGIPVINGRLANAETVATFCFAQVVLANKGFFQNTRMCRNPLTASQNTTHTGKGNSGVSVALIGYGAIAKNLRRLLLPFDIEVLVTDPTLHANMERSENIRLVSLEDAFHGGQVVSNHLPDLPNLEKAIRREHFESMPPYATFINTGRGRQVCEDGLVEVFAGRPDLTALLDVTHPEPPLPGSPLYSLPNIHLTSHIAGVVGNERRVFIETILAEVTRLQEGQPLEHSANIEELDSMG